MNTKWLLIPKTLYRHQITTYKPLSFLWSKSLKNLWRQRQAMTCRVGHIWCSTWYARPPLNHMLKTVGVISRVERTCRRTKSVFFISSVVKMCMALWPTVNTTAMNRPPSDWQTNKKTIREAAVSNSNAKRCVTSKKRLRGTDYLHRFMQKIATIF